MRQLRKLRKFDGRHPLQFVQLVQLGRQATVAKLIQLVGDCSPAFDARQITSSRKRRNPLSDERHSPGAMLPLDQQRTGP